MGSFINRLRLRANMVQENKAYILPFWHCRNTTSMQHLAAAPVGALFGVMSTTHGTELTYLKTTDYSAGSGTATCRIQFPLPAEYVAGSTVTIRIHSKMEGAANVSATVDIEARKGDREQGIGAELYAGAAANANSGNWANQDFALTSSGLAAGDLLDVLLTASIDDTGGVAMAGWMLIGAIEFILGVKG